MSNNSLNNKYYTIKEQTYSASKLSANPNPHFQIGLDDGDWSILNDLRCWCVGDFNTQAGQESRSVRFCAILLIIVWLLTSIGGCSREVSICSSKPVCLLRSARALRKFQARGTSLRQLDKAWKFFSDLARADGTEENFRKDMIHVPPNILCITILLKS